MVYENHVKSKKKFIWTIVRDFMISKKCLNHLKRYFIKWENWFFYFFDWLKKMFVPFAHLWYSKWLYSLFKFPRPEKWKKELIFLRNINKKIILIWFTKSDCNFVWKRNIMKKYITCVNKNYTHFIIDFLFFSLSSKIFFFSIDYLVWNFHSKIIS